MDLGLTSTQPHETGYRVLARKYRPRDFSTLYGQGALVQTLTNALTSGRLAHSFMLTGVRGVGKTTTARIMARALNCSAPGVVGPTPEPCGECENCSAIFKDHHPDVLEMDAASHTGVNNIRDLQETVAYRPTLGRYKIFIIDEVHMLSTSAFNALLKTLEEPPDQVIFIFATTEIRKVPVTVLSRCQRFDLRRIDMGVLIDLFTHVIEQEGVEAEAEALSLIARAADGSARDGLSILDQAISLAGSPVTARGVQDMLGLADRAQVIDLCQHLMGGDMVKTLALFDSLYQAGATPLTVLTDLADLIHWMTRAKIGSGMEDLGLSEAARTQGREVADRLSVAHLARAWQILATAVNEVRGAENPKEAADMALIRLAYAGTLPTPDQIAKKLTGASLNRDDQDQATAQALVSSPTRSPTQAPSPAPQPSHAPSRPFTSGGGEPGFDPLPGSSGADPNVRAIHDLSNQNQRRSIGSLEDILEGLEKGREVHLAADLRAYGQLISLKDGHLELAKNDRLTRDHLNKLSAHLMTWTGKTWLVTLRDGQGAQTLAEEAYAARQARKSAAKNHPLVQAALKTFPGAQIEGVSISD